MESPRGLGSNDEIGKPPLLASQTVPRVPDLRPARAWRKRKAAIAVAACILAAGLLYPFIAPQIERQWRLRELQQLTVLPLTALSGNVASPTFSPDGSQIAFAWDGENNGAGYDLYVKAVGSEKPLRLTHHPSTRLSVAWSPDGKVLAYLDQPVNTASTLILKMFLLSLDTLQRTQVPTECNGAATPSFSPRGTYLAWVCDEGSFKSSLWLLRMRDGSQTKLLARA